MHGAVLWETFINFGHESHAWKRKPSLQLKIRFSLTLRPNIVWWASYKTFECVYKGTNRDTPDRTTGLQLFVLSRDICHLLHGIHTSDMFAFCKDQAIFSNEILPTAIQIALLKKTSRRNGLIYKWDTMLAEMKISYQIKFTALFRFPKPVPYSTDTCKRTTWREWSDTATSIWIQSN